MLIICVRWSNKQVRFQNNEKNSGKTPIVLPITDPVTLPKPVLHLTVPTRSTSTRYLDYCFLFFLSCLSYYPPSYYNIFNSISKLIQKIVQKIRCHDNEETNGMLLLLPLLLLLLLLMVIICAHLLLSCLTCMLPWELRCVLGGNRLESGIMIL